MKKSKNEIIIDLLAMLQSFRYATYCLNFTESFRDELHKIDVLSLSNQKKEIIHGNEFAKLLKTQEGSTYLLGNTSALIRSNLITSSHERVKGYSINSTALNKQKFLLEISHGFETLLQIFHIIRGVTAHWDMDDNMQWKKTYPEKLKYGNLQIKKGMKRFEIVGDNQNVQNLVSGLIEFVKVELE